MYGSYDIPVSIQYKELRISVEHDGNFLIYNRVLSEDTQKKMLRADPGTLLIHPIEPLHIPKKICNYLIIRFENPLCFAPKSTGQIYLTFPIEIGVFIRKNNGSEIIDIVSCSTQKYTLYGTPVNGIICRYWKSEVFKSQPSVNPLVEGIMCLTVINTLPEWVEVNKAVFDAYRMIIFFTPNLATMQSTMRIKNRDSAETDFETVSFETDMLKATKTFPERSHVVYSECFVMESGI